MFSRTRFGLTGALFALSACAPQQTHVETTIAPPHVPRSQWAMAWSDVPPDPGYRFGRLPNGLRYILRHNAQPAGTALVRMEIEAGSLDEADSERGFAHFVEHMAFNGSTHVAEGEMVRLLERKGLAFGADTNAGTSYEETLYRLDLPRADPYLLDTALMLMRETASELTFAPQAVEREKGVVLSEMRDRDTWRLRDYVANVRFSYPQARFSNRLAIGTPQTVGGATAGRLKAFWQRHNVPAKATVIVIGDFDPAVVESAIRARFGDWAPKKAVRQPGAGPVNPRDQGRTELFIDPALSERVVATRLAPWRDEADTIAHRRETVLRDLGYAVINRRLLSLTRAEKPPFRAARFGTANLFRAAKTSMLAIDTVDGKWREGLTAAVREYRRALTYGFTASEVTEQVANLRTAMRNAAAAQDTRTNGQLVDSAITLLRDEIVPALPSDAQARFDALIPQITPDALLKAVQRDAVALRDPVLRFSGRRDPQGGTIAIREAWNAAMEAPLITPAPASAASFVYTDFGSPGVVVSDNREPLLGIRELRFANGVRLNLKHTDIEKDRVYVQFSLDGGDMLNTRDHPLQTEMVSMFAAGGLGKHSQDELQTILAGHTLGSGLGSTPETFVTLAGTTPQDLLLQLQLMAAYLTDPGYRNEGQTFYYNAMNTFFARLRSTPRDALAADEGAILSDNDPRFSLQPIESYRALTFAKLKETLADRLAHGAIEIGVVGDIDEDAAIAAVANTFGALPPRENEFRPYPDQRTHPFTVDRSIHQVHHLGSSDQAIVRLIWPTRDGEDPVETLELLLLDRVAQNRLTETVREALGKAYSPQASSDASRVWRNYGTFTLTAPVAPGEVSAVRAAMLQAVADLRTKPVNADELERARAPMIEEQNNRLKTNRGWITLVDRAQTEADRIDRQRQAVSRLQAITAADVQAMARRYLTPDRAVEIDVLPGAKAPAK